MRLPPLAQILAASAALLLGAGAGPRARAAGTEPHALPFFVGRGACVACHAAGGGASPCTLEPIPAHARSFRALGRPEALEIAALSGCPDPPPSRARVCLGCHAASADDGPRWRRATFRIEDGVQCEACHGAGSRHVRSRRASGGEGGEGGEPVPPSPLDVRHVERTSCTRCHVPLTSHREVLVRGYRRAQADLQYRNPVHLALSPDGHTLYVACERGDRLAVVDPAQGRVVAEIPVGKRPHDVAVSPDGAWLWVTERLANRLAMIDAAARTVVAEIPVGAGPHGVLTNRSGTRVFVLDTGEDAVSVVDAARRTEIRRLAAGNGPWSLARAPDGDTLYVTNVRPQPSRAPFRSPHQSEITVVSISEEKVLRRPLASGANMMQGIAVDPARGVVLFTLMRTKNLVPMTRLAQGWTVTHGLGVLWPDGRVDQVLLDEPASSFADPTDVAVSPDGQWALVTGGGVDEVAVVDLPALLAMLEGASDRDRRRILPDHLGSSASFVTRRVPVGSNPRGVVFSPDGRLAYVACTLDDSVAVLETGSFTVVRRIPLGSPPRTPSPDGKGEITQARLGEKLFHGAAHTLGRQFSCRSCHPDGHDNGLSFDIEADGIGLHPVDNRTLQGITDTAPFKWEGTNPSLRRQCGARFAVYLTRLAPFQPRELDALVAYIRTIERPPNPRRRPEGLTPAERRGKEVFERRHTNDGRPIARERRCATCHRTPYRNSNRPADVGTTMWLDAPAAIDLPGIEDDAPMGPLGMVYFHDVVSERRSFDVPQLLNVREGAPFLHNGCASSLEEIWTRFNLYEGHGRTHDLTRRQLNDLIAYLKTL